MSVNDNLTTKYGWIYIIKQTQNDNLTSDPTTVSSRP
eukprot:COSAG06_NODE_1294_length_9970_cov_3.420120_6_plen_37_part_00